MRYIHFIILYMAGVFITSGIAQNYPLKRYCSSALNDVLKLVCNGNFNSLGHFYQEQAAYAESLLLSKLVGHESVYRYHHVKRRSPITDECCSRPCSYNQLKSYCAPET